MNYINGIYLYSSGEFIIDIKSCSVSIQSAGEYSISVDLAIMHYPFGFLTGLHQIRHRFPWRPENPWT